MNKFKQCVFLYCLHIVKMPLFVYSVHPLRGGTKTPLTTPFARDYTVKILRSALEVDPAKFYNPRG